MNIQYAILGLLSFEALTGYDIKKAMQSSPLFHWSGNNSQVYRALAELQADGLVTAVVIRDEALPTKKRYSLTEQGKKELSDMSRAFPELPEMRKPILMQLCFGQDLTRQETESILSQYEGEIRGILLTVNGRVFPQNDNPFQSAVHDLTRENIREFYESELRWVDRVRQKALPLAKNGMNHKKVEVNTMKYTVTNKNAQTYVTVTDGQIRDEQDGLTLVSICAENGANLLMLPAECLSEDFLRLSTRVAGLVLQKLGNYNIKTVAILNAERAPKRFREFLSEANQGRTFRIYSNFKDAEAWLVGGTD